MSLLLSWMAVAVGGDEVIARGVLRMFSREEHGHLSQRGQIVDLYDKLRPSLYGYLICLGLMPQEADDVIQEAFLRLFQLVHSGRKVENIRGWLFRVVHNLSVNLQKHERRTVSDAAEDRARLDVADTALNPEQLYLHKERQHLLEAAMSQLTGRQRECLHLRAEGLRYREIAEVLGARLSSVEESLRRAVVRLMSELYE